MVTSIDLVHWQIRIAQGERLSVDPERALTPHGHAIECRIYAEDPDEGFMPSPGLVRALHPASGPGIRNDGGVVAGYTVPVFYDSMIAKLIAWAASRDEARARMERALREYEVLGIRTTIPFFLWLMHEPDFVDGRFDTTYLDGVLASRRGESFVTLTELEETELAIAAGLDAWWRGASNGRASSSGLPGSGWKSVGRQDGLRG
jgi:acetyl-CoA carboxylase, biotin carboxylase subunit